MKNINPEIELYESNYQKKEKRKYYNYSLEGKVFDKLIVKKFSHSEKNNRYWDCVCECGGNITVNTRSLNYGSVRSCGCLKGVNSRTKPYGSAAFYRLYRRYIRQAEKRKVPFELSESEFRNITGQNCHYCNSFAAQSVEKHVFKTTGDYPHNGIDRLNSKMGYTLDNVVSCCGICNRAKHTLSYEIFKEWIRRLK
jgi:hypothetical protein